MKSILVMLLLAWCFVSKSQAQSCPPNVLGKVEVQNSVAGWIARADTETFDLERISIVDGPISDDSSEADAELKPLEKDGIQYWAFGEAIGAREIWMRCEYARSSVSLKMRVYAETALCFQKKEKSSAKSSNGRIAAMCVDSIHQANETLRPYQAKRRGR